MGPPWGPKVPLKVRNTRLGHEITFSEKFGEIMKIRNRKKNPLSASGNRPLLGSVSSRCPSGRRFAPYPGSKRRVAGQVPLFERNGTQGNRSAVSYVRITSVTSLLLPKFVDALLGMCVFFSGTSLVCAGALWLHWTAYVVPPLGGGEGWVGRTLAVH